MIDSRSREAFEAWMLTQGVPEACLERHEIGYYLEESVADSWEGWQAGQADGRIEAAKRCAELLCIHCANGIEYDASVRYHPANNRGGVFDCGAARIRREFPEAWK